MALENTIMKVAATGDDAELDFPFTFPIIRDDSAEIKVYLSTVLDPSDEALQVEGVDYNLTGSNPPSKEFHDNVEMVVAPTSLQRVLIKRVPPRTQPLDLKTNGNVNLAGTELALDDTQAQVQELNEQLSRVPKFKNSSQSSAPFLDEPVDGQILQWSSGQLTNASLTTTDAALATQAEAEGGTENTAFMSALRVQQKITSDLATQAEAEAGINATQIMTPVRTEQHAVQRQSDELALGSFVSQDAGAMFNLGLASSVGSSALTITLTQADGSSIPTAASPVKIAFRSASATVGGFRTINKAATEALVIPSGATLGQKDATEHELWVYAVDDGGADFQIGTSERLFDERSLHTTTAIGTGSDSANILYTTDVLAGAAIRVIGKLVNTQTTAGTWASAGSELSAQPRDLKQKKVVASYGTNSAHTLVNVTALIINFEDVVIDTHKSVIIGASWDFVAQRDMRVYISAAIRLAATASTDFTTTLLARVGAAEKFRASVMKLGTATLRPNPRISGILDLSAGDILDFTGEQDSGGNINLDGSFANYVTIHEVLD